MTVTALISLLIVIVKIVIVFMVLSVLVVFIVWFERKVVAHMQSRIGPNRWGPYGLLTSLADGVKLFFKEGIVPTTADRVTFLLAPGVSVIAAFLAFAPIPFGTQVVIFHRHVSFQITDLNVGLLWVLAMGSLAVYGVVLAGWSSGSKYPLLGGIRSSAQMISYEIALSLSLVPVVMSAGSLSLRSIVAKQGGTIGHINWLGPLGNVGKAVPHWYVFYHLPAFLIFLLAGVAETNRPPFDLAEADSELVGGYHTEYSGIKFAMFFLAEYLHVVTISAVAVLLFFGGWNGVHFSFLGWLWPLAWFVAKTFFFVFLFVWLRATLPRLRYDRLMEVGWKVLIPAALAWLVISGAAMAGGV
ncbi:MAG TPA: NADH-quinone oxidoreductase subunit NuoH [Actinomycetota bacterium]|nr:NADH-quinone oxidoreductase subunit NuoH [Actinomycetota bacterium]